MRCILLFDLRFAIFAESQRNYRLAALTAFLFRSPLLVVAERWLQPRLLCVDTHLVPDGGELAEVDRTDALQVWNMPEASVLVFIFLQYANVHQHIHRSRVTFAPALAIHEGMDFNRQFMIVHS